MKLYYAEVHLLLFSQFWFKATLAQLYSLATQYCQFWKNIFYKIANETLNVYLELAWGLQVFWLHALWY